MVPTYQHRFLAQRFFLLAKAQLAGVVGSDPGKQDREELEMTKGDRRLVAESFGSIAEMQLTTRSQQSFYILFCFQV